MKYYLEANMSDVYWVTKVTLPLDNEDRIYIDTESTFDVCKRRPLDKAKEIMWTIFHSQLQDIMSKETFQSQMQIEYMRITVDEYMNWHKKIVPHPNSRLSNRGNVYVLETSDEI